MNRSSRLVLIVIAVALVGALIWLRLRPPGGAVESSPPPASPTAAAAAEVAPAAPAEAPPPVHVELPSAAPEVVAALDGSDAAVLQALTAAVDHHALDLLLVPRTILQRIVVTVDSLTREPAPLRFRAFPLVPSLPLTGNDADGLYWSEDNGRRYAPYVAALQAVDVERLVDAYVRYYPLLQQIYKDLGYPEGSFNDRLLAVIDHLLASPEAPRPLRLLRPKVLYLFADAAQEQASSGRKLMWRLTPEQQGIVKARLQDLRKAIVARGVRS